MSKSVKYLEHHRYNQQDIGRKNDYKVYLIDRYINQKFQKISYNINLNFMNQRDQPTQNNLQFHAHPQIVIQNPNQIYEGQINFQSLQNEGNRNSKDAVQNDKFWTKKRKIILVLLLISLSILTTVTAVLCVTILNKKKYKSSAKARQIILVGGQVIGLMSLKSTNNSCQLICTKVIKKEEERLLQAEEQPQLLVHEIWNEEQVVVTVGNNKQIIHALNWTQAQLQSELASLGNQTQVTVERVQYSTYRYNKETNKYELQEDNKINQNLRRVLYEKKPPKGKTEDAWKNTQNIMKQKEKYLVKGQDYEGTLGPDDRKESGKQFQQNCFPKSKDEIICKNKNKNENEQKNGTRKPRSWQIIYNRSN